MALLLLVVFTAGCGGGKASAPGPAGSPVPAQESAFTLSAPAFKNGEPIPQDYTCRGADRSPELVWSAPPDGTASLALLVEDPDAPNGMWTHWVLYNLAPDLRGLPEGAPIPAGAVQGPTSFGTPGYGGPCPPSGTHRYFFRLYALDTTLPEGLDRGGLLKAVEGHVLASAEWMGVFSK